MPNSSPILPAATRHRHRRRRLPSSSSSSSTSSSATTTSTSTSSSHPPFTFPFSPAPSPFHHRFFLSPLCASAVPFSWEHRPGIPKTPARHARSSGKPAKPLPLPPSLLYRDPYASVAPVEFAPAMPERKRLRKRRSALASSLADWLAVLSLYRSCAGSTDCFAGSPAPAKVV